ncbi:hypothetical protein Tco_0512634 [Tanacetum coccineum]
MYSASVLEIPVLFYFFEDQPTNLSPKNCALPEDQPHLWRTSRKVEIWIEDHTKRVEPALSHGELSSACTRGWDGLDLRTPLVD